MKSRFMNSPTSRFAGILLSLVLISPLRAEMSPEVYKKWQHDAPEALVIKVLSVKKTETKESRGTLIDVTVTARVQEVERSQAGLKPGDTITIRYERIEYTQPIAGPSQPPILGEGKEYPAFLAKEKDGESYSLA